MPLILLGQSHLIGDGQPIESLLRSRIDLFRFRKGPQALLLFQQAMARITFGKGAMLENRMSLLCRNRSEGIIQIVDTSFEIAYIGLYQDGILAQGCLHELADLPPLA